VCSSDLKNTPEQTETQEIEFNDEMSFGSGFDPSEWA
jgi:hypothetical protein